MSSIEKEIVYPVAPAAVWRGLTDREALATWLMPNDFTPQVGHRFTLRTRPAPGFDGTVHCQVLELEEPRRMVWSWRGGPIDTVVTFDLDEVRGGTRLRFRQEGFSGFRENLVRLMLAQGWRRVYGRGLGGWLSGTPSAVDCSPRGTAAATAVGFLTRRSGRG